MLKLVLNAGEGREVDTPSCNLCKRLFRKKICDPIFCLNWDVHFKNLSLILFNLILLKKKLHCRRWCVDILLAFETNHIILLKHRSLTAWSFMQPYSHQPNRKCNSVNVLLWYHNIILWYLWRCSLKFLSVKVAFHAMNW